MFAKQKCYYCGRNISFQRKGSKFCILRNCRTEYYKQKLADKRKLIQIEVARITNLFTHREITEIFKRVDKIRFSKECEGI